MRQGSLLLLALLMMPAPGRAAVGRYLAPTETAARAQVVVEGTVTALAARDDARWRRFVTEATVSVERAWRGAPTGSVKLLLLGGEVGDRVQLVPGEATLRVGERVLLFLEPITGRAEWRPVGMKQGVFRPAPGGGWRREFDGLAVAAPGDLTAHEPAPETLPPTDLPALLEAHPFAPGEPTPAAPSTVAP